LFFNLEISKWFLFFKYNLLSLMIYTKFKEIKKKKIKVVAK